MAEDVRNALGKLPARQRTALVLRFFADLPEAEVADLMGCSPGTVKSHTHRGLQAMRRLISPETVVNRTERQGSGIR
ncbi:sigma-70 family RNA polymerase sigma factor [Sphaerisporangium sp. NPDC051017]|uniref:sigma-70 family RNA polymerase sigma factor n=1 Tax=Sphaerisporangium sp. NPDC051017 TaxID=3154636 RepID=UPI003441F9F3